MIIDSEERVDIEKDELVSTKNITTDPYKNQDTTSTHIVKYYKTEDEEEYYIFYYIMAYNNGRNLSVKHTC